MPKGPSGANTKKEGGRAKKAESAQKKADAVAVDKELQEAATWEDTSKGGKAKREALEAKRKADIARKAENARLLAEEEASLSAKPKPAKRINKQAAAAESSAGGDPDSSEDQTLKGDLEPKQVESYAASGIDNALDLLEVVTAKMDKATIGAKASEIEQHPERRFKAAFESYQERELPDLREKQPGLRLRQYQDLMYKQFQKSPENPYNQTTVAFNASKDEKVEALNRKRTDVENRLRDG